MKRNPRAFNAAKFARQLNRTGESESRFEPVESIEACRDLISRNKHRYPYFPIYLNLYKHLTHDEVLVLCRIYNIFGMKQAEHKVCEVSLAGVEGVKGKAAAALAAAIKKHPSLASGWFELTSYQMRGDFKMGRFKEGRVITSLKDKGLLLTVTNHKRERFVRLNVRLFLKLSKAKATTKETKRKKRSPF